MASILLKVTFITACLCWSTCLSQTTEELLLAFVKEATEEIKAVSKKITELDGKFTKFVELDDKFGDVQGELQLLQQRDLQKDRWTNMCTELQANFSTEFQKMKASMEECSSVDQLSNLTMLLAKDECAEGSHDCSPHAVCEDAIVYYKCTCLPGYAGDGFTCEDVDECERGEHSCHDHAECSNMMGNYTCVCNPGFSGDGFSCEDDDECRTRANRCHNDAECSNIPGNYTCACKHGFSGDGFSCEISAECVFPSLFMPSLGCITLVMEERGWESARKNCIRLGSRLLQGITNFDELQQLDEQFGPYSARAYYKYFVWIGLKGDGWIEGGDPIINDPPSSISSLWEKGQPNDGDAACVYALLDSSPSLYDFRDCSSSFYSLCQRK